MTEIEPTEPVRPRRVRRWLIIAVIVLTPFAVHAIWDQIEATRLARDIAAIAGRGEAVNVLNRRGELSDPELRRSAALYAAAAELARWQGDSRIANKDIEDHSNDAQVDTAALHKYVADAEPTLQLLAAATPLRFTEFGSIAPELVRNASSLQALNAVNCASADVLSAAGDGDAAADVLVRSVRLQRTIARVFYRRFAVSRLYGSLRILLAHTVPGSESLQRLQAALEEWPDDDGMEAEVLAGRAELLGDYWPYPSERHSWALRAQEPRRWGVPTSIRFVVFRPILTRALRGELGPYEEVLAVARQSWPGKLDAERTLESRYAGQMKEASQERWTLGWLTMPPAMALFTLSRLPTAGANLAMRRTAIVTIAIERFRRDHAGEPPASLQALVPQYLAAVPQDPFSGKPLILKVDPAAYTVYSVDINRTDDGGALYGAGTGTKDRWRKAADTTPGDIGIRVPRGVGG